MATVSVSTGSDGFVFVVASRNTTMYLGDTIDGDFRDKGYVGIEVEIEKGTHACIV